MLIVLVLSVNHSLEDLGQSASFVNDGTAWVCAPEF